MAKYNLNEKYKFFEQGISSALYVVETGEIFRVFDENLRQQFSQVLNQGVENIETINILKNLNLKKDELISQKNISLLDPKQMVINKLSIVLTNQCNLRCKYCYANYGQYNYTEKINRELTFT